MSYLSNVQTIRERETAKRVAIRERAKTQACKRYARRRGHDQNDSILCAILAGLVLVLTLAIAAVLAG